MNKKSIIQAVVIVACFGGAGMVLYNGFFKNSSSDLATGVAPVANIANKEPILPFGALSENSLLSAFKKPKFLFGQQDYPKLDPGSDLGINEEELIKPLPKPAENP